MLARWDLVERDLQDRGVDMSDPLLRRTRSWRWLMTRVIGLLQVDSRLRRALVPDGGVSARQPQADPDVFD